MISKLICTDVLAIRCIKDFIFVGIGCTLHVFNKNTFELVNKFRCLYPHNIHGIIEGPENKLAIFGANAIRFYDVLTENEEFKLQECFIAKELNDWIIAVKWFSNKGKVYLVVLYAHNNVYVYNITDEYHQTIQCQEKCILYGGSISVQDSGNVIILSGTVFQEILIWELKADSVYSKDVDILHRLRGHNGVIFSVIYDPIKQLICSTSDDRTVRLWKLNFPNTTEGGIRWKDAEVKLVKTIFGHSARVWRSVIKNDTLITIGEDSLMCTWSLNGELLNKIYAHRGAAIWSIEVLDDGDSILTGGADGAVYAWSLNNSYTQRPVVSPEHNLANSKYVCYLNTGTFLIFTENGQLLAYDKGEDYPRETFVLEKYSTYCLMQVSLHRSCVAFASRDGYVSIYEEVENRNNKRLVKLFEAKVISSQIFSLHWLAEDSMVVCGADGLLKVFSFVNGAEIKTISINVLPPTRERWLTAAIIYNNQLICGDRAGRVHVYKLNNFGSADLISESFNSPESPSQTYYKVHGKIGVQTFAVVNEKLMSTGRDGTVRFYELKNSQEADKLCDLHREKMPMDWIGKVFRAENDILLLGFKEAEFIIYSMLHQRILRRITCGGGHRSWDCILSNGFLKFAFIRKKQVFEYQCCLNIIKRPVLLNGFHAKEVYCIRVLERLDEESILVSGGEDGTLRVTCIRNNSKTQDCTFQSLGVFDGHISSIKSVAVTRVSDDPLAKKYIAFSVGGRAQLKVWEICINLISSSVRPVDISCSDVATHLLYGLNKSRKNLWQEKEESYAIEPETRYMDVDVYQSSKSLPYIFLFTASADGFLRMFLYRTDIRTIELRVCAKCVDRCIIKVHRLQFEDRAIVLTMSTDGIVRFFDFTESIKNSVDPTNINSCVCHEIDIAPFKEINVHQCGINSYDLREIGRGKYLLATGGDDNLINLICFRISFEEEQKDKVILSLLSQWSTSSAHSTQVTGIQFSNNRTMCSVGMDQRIIVYNINYVDDVLSAEISRELFITSIADVQGLAVWSLKKEENMLACIYGKGFEILSI